MGFSSGKFLVWGWSVVSHHVHFTLQVLKLTGIGVLDDFYELGGTSILAGRIASLMEQQLGQPITGAMVLQKRRIRDLCMNVEQLGQRPLVEAQSPVDYMHLTSQNPAHILSSGQEQMLILHHHDPSSGFYNQPLVLALYGTVDRDRLSSCIQALIRRHDILRTTYKVRESGSWVPAVVDPADEHIKLSEVDLTDLEVGYVDILGILKGFLCKKYLTFLNLFNFFPRSLMRLLWSLKRS